MTRFIILEKPKLLDTQEESEDHVRVEDEGPLTECGEHGNRKKTNAEDKKTR